MKPSDARVRQKKDQLQQARNARGKSWQDDLLAVLGGIPLGLWAINTYYMPLDVAINRGIGKLGLTEIAAQTRETLGQ